MEKKKYTGDLTIAEWQEICKKFSENCDDCPMDAFCDNVVCANGDINRLELSDFGSIEW